MKRLKDWFKGLTTAGKLCIISVIAFVSLGAVGTVQQPASSSVANKNSATIPAKATNAVKVDTVEVKQATSTQAIPYASSIVEDASLAQGLTQTRTAGVNGVRTITYDVTYTNGLETSRKTASSVITTPPIDEVIAKGTKAPQPSCANGTYVNSLGNTVCRPVESDTPPAGASAQCRDGSYSYSQSRSGTCSHHGGVARWL